MPPPFRNFDAAGVLLEFQTLHLRQSGSPKTKHYCMSDVVPEGPAYEVGIERFVVLAERLRNRFATRLAKRRKLNFSLDVNKNKGI